MDARIAYAAYRGLGSDLFTFLYSGRFHDEHTARLIDLGEAAMESAGAARSARQRLSYVMVEAYQNIIRHRAPLPEALARGYGRSIFQLRCHEGAQQVIAVNPVRIADRQELESALDAIAGLDAGALKERFLRTLSREGHRERGGAGLGLIEMARRSGRDLHHEIRGLGEDNLLFLLQVRFGEHSEVDRGVAMTALLSGTIVQQDILFLFKGPRSSAVDEALMQLTARDLDDRTERAEERERTLLAALGLLEGLIAPDAQRVVVMARNGERYDVVVGCALPDHAAETLARLVQEVNAMDETAQRAVYRDLVLGRGGGGDPVRLATVEVARRSTEPLEVDLVPMGAMRFVAVRAVV